MVLSLLPEAKDLPSGLKDREFTLPPCPKRVRFSVAVAKSQSFMVLSVLHVATVCPSRLNATDLTERLCPFNIRGAGGC
jgi:hypothetical protein